MERIFRYPWVIIGIVMAITFFFSLQLPKTTIDNDVSKFIPENHPTRIALDNVEDTFGSQSFISIGLKARDGTIFTTGRMGYVKRITEELKKLPYIEKVESLTDADFIEGTSEGMVVRPIIDAFRGTEEEVYLIKEKLMSWDVYRKNLYSDDFRSTQIIVRLSADLPIEIWEKAYYDIKALLKGSELEGFESYVAGTPVIAALMSNNMRGDLRRLIPFVVLVIVTSLYLSFRRPGGVILPLVTVLISSIWTTGLLAMLGISLTMIAVVIPVILIAVGSAYGIHIINQYYDEVREQKNPLTVEENRKAVVEALRKVIKPVVLAGLTTVAGFGSLSVSPIIPMKHFGIFTSIGVLVALIVALAFIPSLLILKGSGEGSKKQEANSGLKKKSGGRLIFPVLRLYAGAIIRRGFVIVAVIILIIPVSLFGVSRIIVDNSIIEYFKKSTEIRRADSFLREYFGGTKHFSIVVKGKNRGDLTNPEVLKAMDELASYLVTRYPDEVGKVISFTDFLKRMNMVMNVPDIENSYESVELVETSGYEGSFFTEEFLEDVKNPGEIKGRVENEYNTGSTGAGTREVPYIRQLSKTMTSREFLELVNRMYTEYGNTSMSARDFIGLLNRRFNFRGEAYYEIPYDPSKYPVSTREEFNNLITQYLLLYSGSLEDFIDEPLEPSQARMLVQMRTTGDSFTKRIDADIRRFVSEHFPEGYKVELAGTAYLESALTDLIVKSQLYSMVASFLLVYIIISVSFKSSIAGLFGVIPLSFAILVNFALMGYTGIKLDISTAMVSSIAIGVGIDYSIHILSRYHRERKLNEDLAVVTRRTLFTTGKAIMFNAVSVGAGIGVLIFSNFNPLMFSGLLVSIIMITSSLAAMTLLPLLLNIFNPGFIKK